LTLRWRPLVAEDDRHLFDAELLCGLQAQVAIDDFTVAARQHRILKPNSRKLLHMRPTTASFFLGLRASSTSLSTGHGSICVAIPGILPLQAFR
jgi:hypothetical protein